MRNVLPSRRHIITDTIYFNGSVPIHVQRGYAKLPPKHLMEVFFKTNKMGSEMDTTLQVVGILISLSLQHGCPLETILENMVDVQPDSLMAFLGDHLKNVCNY